MLLMQIHKGIRDGCFVAGICLTSVVVMRPLRLSNEQQPQVWSLAVLCRVRAELCPGEHRSCCSSRGGCTGQLCSSAHRTPALGILEGVLAVLTCFKC